MLGTLKGILGVSIITVNLRVTLITEIPIIIVH